MLKWVDHSTDIWESWQLIWQDSKKPHTGMKIALIYNSKENGNLTGKWCLEMVGGFHYLDRAKTTEDAKHIALIGVLTFAESMAHQASAMARSPTGELD